MIKKKKYQEKMRRLEERLREAKKIALLTHKRPDGDALGSTLALMMYLHDLGKEAQVFYAEEADNCLDYLPQYTSNLFIDEKKTAEEFRGFDLMVICDACDLGRTGIFQETAFDGGFVAPEKLVFIDHHENEVGTECGLAIMDKDKAATSFMIYEYFIFAGARISKDMATCLLTGIFTDTGGFLHANTSSGIMKAASFLMRRGAALSQIARHNFSNKKVHVMKIWGRALERTSLNKKNRMAFSYVTKKDLDECGACARDLSGVTNILGSAQESVYSMLLAEVAEDRVKGSLRSEEYKNCDVSRIAREFGGGGHKLASGFELKGKIVKDGNGAKVN